MWAVLLVRESPLLASLDCAHTDIGTAWSRKAKESSSYVIALKFHPIHRRTYCYAVIIRELASGTTVASDSPIFRNKFGQAS